MLNLSTIAPNRSKSRGVSLIEALVTITVVAIIVGISIPVISSILQRSQESAARRNAQAIAGLANSASAAGNTEISSAASKEAALELLTFGVTGEGPFSDSMFIVNIDRNNREQTLKFLVLRGGKLEFDPPVE
jgi:Tfp pilus assembly protein FimT